MQTLSTSLPGWQWDKFGNVIAESQAGFACGERDRKGVIQLRMNNVDTRGNLVWDEFLRVPADNVTVERYRLKPGDIVFNNTNSTELVGKSALFQDYVEPVVYSNHFTRLRVKLDLADPGFITFWLISQWQAKTFEKICNRWIGQSAVKNDKLFELEIPLPPLNEQRRIAARINEQMAAVEAARRAAESQLQAIQELPAAYARCVFESHKDWRISKLGEVCEINPRRPAMFRDDFAMTTFVPMSAVDEVNGAIVSPEQKPYLDVKKGYTYFAENDVIFAKITPCMENGKQAIARDLFDGIGFGSTEFHVIRPNNQIIAEWIWYFVRQPSVRRAATNHFTGAVGQQRVPDNFLKSLEIPLPPLNEQMRITACLSEQTAAVKQMRQAAEKQLAIINQLPAALLRQAFSGGLS